jgi:hypothetical protein
MVVRLSQIDALTRGDHVYLGEPDQVYFLREYTSRVGYTHSETNRLILNLKKSIETRGTPQWSYKEKAIDQLGRELRSVINPEFVKTAVWVPVPPSKAIQHTHYDDRMTRVLRGHFRMETSASLSFNGSLLRLAMRPRVVLQSWKSLTDIISMKHVLPLRRKPW